MEVNWLNPIDVFRIIVSLPKLIQWEVRRWLDMQKIRESRCICGALWIEHEDVYETSYRGREVMGKGGCVRTGCEYLHPIRRVGI